MISSIEFNAAKDPVNLEDFIEKMETDIYISNLTMPVFTILAAIRDQYPISHKKLMEKIFNVKISSTQKIDSLKKAIESFEKKQSK